MIHEPVFYDCEASAQDGAPIDVGWALVANDGEIASDGCLIKPQRSWRIAQRWDPEAEALHSITIAMLLADGIDVWQVAKRMNVALSGRQLFADSPFDEHWLRFIFDEAGEEPSFEIRQMSADILIARRMDEVGVEPASAATDHERCRAVGAGEASCRGGCTAVGCGVEFARSPPRPSEERQY